MLNRTASARGSHLESALRRLGGLALVAVVSLAAAGCDKLKARDMLNQGVQAYKASQYDAAIEKFKKAKDLDPSLQTARLYLATAYANQYVPGSPEEANVDKAKQAIAEYRETLQRYPGNLPAIDGLGSMLYRLAGGPPPNIDMLKESRSFHQQHIKLKPDDPEPYYWVGEIDWELSYKANMQARQNYNADVPTKKQVKVEEPLPDKIRQPFAAAYTSDIDEGIAALKQAIVLRPDYDDAMGMLNLLYRQKADTVDSSDERAKLLDNADTLVKQSIEIKQKRSSQPATPAS
jgi:tetratricopeptide (TPR) repeat protein